MKVLSTDNKYLFVLKPICIGLSAFICQVLLFKDVLLLLPFSSLIIFLLTYHYSDKKLKKSYDIYFDNRSLKLENTQETRLIPLKKILHLQKSNSYIKLFGVTNYGYNIEFKNETSMIEKIVFYVHESENNIELLNQYLKNN